ncbi:MAG: DUF3482 domain-containing protein [Gammaproteobacteria bacterium]|nr:DUF3482 domain-containing protein [Gammaproteobacteria bacterium]
MTEPLKLAVVGHANVGKTSLMRTLLRDPEFGVVAHTPGTTRHVEGARMSVAGDPVLELYDTPGLEDAIELLARLDQPLRPNEQLDGPARLERFLQTYEAHTRFEQESKVIRQLLGSTAGLYVIDVREPVLAKYRDELAILAMCGRPLLPVLNFVNAENREAAWRTALARLGLHAVVCFDTVAPSVDGEPRLYESLALLIEAGRPQLQRVLDDHLAQRRLRRQAGARLIAELLLDSAAAQRTVAAADVLHETTQLQVAIREREQVCVKALLRCYNFHPNDVVTHSLPLLAGRWRDDLFNPETLRVFGVRIGTGMVAGAAAGVGIDIFTGGLSLGAATLLGALIGGAWQSVGHYGTRLRGKLQGQRTLTIDDSIVCLLVLRQSQLLAMLERRGHAALEAMTLEAPNEAAWITGKLPETVRKARAHPEWSTLNSTCDLDTPRRSTAIENLMAALIMN